MRQLQNAESAWINSSAFGSFVPTPTPAVTPCHWMAIAEPDGHDLSRRRQELQGLEQVATSLCRSRLAVPDRVTGRDKKRAMKRQE